VQSVTAAREGGLDVDPRHPGLVRQSSERGHRGPWGMCSRAGVSCKDGLEVRAQRGHIGRASGREGKQKGTRQRHAGEQSVNTYQHQSDVA
jgi:hypothetical protein